MNRSSPTRSGGGRAATVAALALITVVGSGCSGGSEASNDPGDGSPSTPVTLVLDWSPNTNHAGIYLAEANGWYDEAGIDLTIIEPGENGALQALATDSADFAISTQEDLTPARAAGVPVVSVAAIIQHNTSSLISLADDGIVRPSDLDGHRYGGWGGPLESAILNSLVSCDGGDPESVEFVNVGETDYRIGLESDRYDAAWVYDGWDKIRLEQADVDTNSIPFADHLDCIPDWYTPLLATSQAMIDEHPETVGRFVDVTARGYRAAIQDPDAAAAALLAAAPELDTELVLASSRFLSTRYADDPAMWGHQDPAVWTRFTDYLDEAGMLSEPVDPMAAFTNRFIDAAE